MGKGRFTSARLSCSKLSTSTSVLSLFGREAGQQAPFALERDHDDAVVQGAPRRRQRGEAAARVRLVGADGHQPPALHEGQAPADRPLVEADDLADAGGRDGGLDGKHGEDAPLSDAHAEMPTIEGGAAARELVGNEGQQGRNVAGEVEDGAAVGIRLIASRRGGLRLAADLTHCASRLVARLLIWPVARHVSISRPHIPTCPGPRTLGAGPKIGWKPVVPSRSAGRAGHQPVDHLET